MCLSSIFKQVAAFCALVRKEILFHFSVIYILSYGYFGVDTSRITL